jgi:hypothetical protein
VSGEGTATRSSASVLFEIKARYMEKAKREIEEQMAKFGMQDNGWGAG